MSEQSQYYVHYAFFAIFIVALMSLSSKLSQDRDLERMVVDVFLLFLLLVSVLYAWYLLPAFAVIALATLHFHQ